MMMHLLTEELSVQVSWITIFIFLCLGHVHAHVTPPHYAKKSYIIYINPKYKVFVLFYINNMQVIFYKSNKVLANKIIAKINIAYTLYLIKEVK
jgi:hypothetical protein